MLSSVPDAQAVETHQLEFTGRASEYFRVWVVNLGLTILTFGLYSAWAKVRTLRWFYRHTRLAGTSFDYTADPWRILRGRLFAAGILVASSMAGELTPILGAAVGIAIFLASPWLIVRALAFRFHHTVYRNVRFGFAREYGQAAKAYALYPVAASLSLGALLPLARLRQYQFLVTNTRYGTAPFGLRLRLRDFYRIYLACAVPFGLVVAGWIALPPELRPVILAYALWAALVTYWLVSAATTNLVFRGLTVGRVSFASRLRFWRLGLLQTTNTLAVVLSFGLLVPWARVRMARYRASCVTVHAPNGLEGFVAACEAEVSALGQEIGEIFDVGLDVGI